MPVTYPAPPILLEVCPFCRSPSRLVLHTATFGSGKKAAAWVECTMEQCHIIGPSSREDEHGNVTEIQLFACELWNLWRRP